MVMGKFVVNVRKNGEYQFILKANNGHVILTSEGFATKPYCLNTIESVRKNSQDENRFIKETARNGMAYFNLKATNGQIIGNSELYESESGRDNGIASVQYHAPGADIVEE